MTARASSGRAGGTADDGGPGPRFRRQLHNVPLPEPFLAAVAAGLVFQRIRTWQLPLPPRTRLVCAGASTAVGAMLAVWSVRAAGPVDLETPGGLVTAGPYSIVRNPMYDAWGLLCIASGLATGSWWPVVFAPIAGLAVHREVLVEEQRLGGRFGDEYRDYRANVPRYVPDPRRILTAVR